MPVHHQTGTHLSETREGIRDRISPFETWSPLKSRIILHPLQPHNSLQPPRCILESWNIFILSVLTPFFFCSSCFIVASAFSSLFSFCSSSPYAASLKKNCPRANNITDTRDCLLFLLSLPAQLTTFNKIY